MHSPLAKTWTPVLPATIAIALVLASCSHVTTEPTAEPGEPVTAAAPTTSTWTLDTSIGSIVAERPETARVFELVGIDYCCGGETPLREAASEEGVDAAQLLSALTTVGASPRAASARDWNTAEISDLMDHIVATHHTWLRRELPLISEATQTVLRVHGENHPELTEIAATFEGVHTALLPHLEQEEQHLFPAIRALAAGENNGEVKAQLASMHADHDEIGAALHRLRSLTGDFEPPADACAKYKEMLSGFLALERDIHTHVHLENNVLMPRAELLLRTL